MNKMFVLGAYGCGNRGDDAILQSICEQFPDWKICATTGAYENIAKYFPIQTVSCRLNEGFSLSVLGSMIKDSFQILAALSKCDLLMYGGGSLIHDLTPYNLPFLFFWQTWAKLLRKKVCYYSMGIGPLETPFGKKLCKSFLRRADAVYVRDYRGYDLCRELQIPNVELTADAAFAVVKPNQCQGNTLTQMDLTAQNYFCVTGSQWFKSSNFWKRNKMDFSEDAKKFANIIRLIAARMRQPVVFVPTVIHDDILAHHLKKLLSDIDFRIVPSDWNCMQMAEIIENSSFLFGVRMHSIIFAARQQVPFLALVYDEKVRQLLKYLELEELEISFECWDENTVSSKLEAILAQEEAIREKLRLRTNELSKKVLASTQMLKKMFSC